MRSEIMKMLKNESEKHTPDVFKKVMNAANEQYLFYDLRREANRNNGNNGNRGGRGKSAPLSGGARAAVSLSSMLIALAIGTVAVFAVWGDKITSLFQPIAPTFPMSDTYSLGAVSAAKLLAESVSEEATDSELNDNLKVFDRYFKAFDLFAAKLTVADAAGGNGYAAATTVKVDSYYGATGSVYAMYFTETENEENSAMRAAEGEIAAGGKKFAMRGERRVNKDKHDEELSLKVFADGLDGKSYVQVESTPAGKTDPNGREYCYTVVVNGKTETAKVKIGVDATYSLDVDGANGGSYRVYAEDKAGSDVTVGYTYGGESGTFKIQPKDGGYDYVFGGAKTVATGIKPEYIDLVWNKIV